MSFESVEDIIKFYSKEDKQVETVKPDELEGIVDISEGEE
jgi:hypothetical protein